MKKIAKIIAALCFNLILCGSCSTLAQTVTPNTDNLIVTEFVCFAHDGGTVQLNVPVKHLLECTPLLTPTKNCKVHRSSMEDIWLENQENEIANDNTKESNPANLFAKN